MQAGDSGGKGETLTSGGAESTGSPRGSGEIALFPFHRFIAGNYHLGDAISPVDFEGIAAQVQKNDAQFPAISGVDGSGRIRQRDGMFQGKTTPRPNLSLVAGRKFDREAGGDEFGFARGQRNIFDRVQVHTRVFGRAVRIPGKNRVLPELLNPEFRQAAMIAV